MASRDELVEIFGEENIATIPYREALKIGLAEEDASPTMELIVR
jgi:hypothetical protein